MSANAFDEVLQRADLVVAKLRAGEGPVSDDDYDALGTVTMDMQDVSDWSRHPEWKERWRALNAATLYRNRSTVLCNAQFAVEQRRCAHVLLVERLKRAQRAS